MSSQAAPTILPPLPAGALLNAAHAPGVVGGGGAPNAVGMVNPPPPPAGATLLPGVGMIQPPPLNAFGGGGVPPPLNATPVGAGGGGLLNPVAAGAGHDLMEALMESVGATRHQVTYELIRRGRSDTWEDSVSPLRAITCRAENTNV